VKKISIFLLLMLTSTTNVFCIGSGTTVICNLKDNKKGTYSFTTDDGILSSVQSYNADFKRLNLCGSMALIAKRISTAPPSVINQWNNILADGHFNVTNHSMTHVNFTVLSKNQSGLDSLNDEINGAQSILKSLFPGQDVITMANPYLKTTLMADSLIRLNHFAARNGYRGYNSLNPTDAEWYRLTSQSTYDGITKSSNELNAYLDYAIQHNKWLILLAHGIGNGPYQIPQAEITAHFEYLASKLDTVWCGTFNEVTKYIRERQNATIVLKNKNSNRITISLSHTLNPKVFSFPLTLKTQVPLEWNVVTVTQNGIYKNTTSCIENGIRYVYYDAIPNSGDIVLKKK